MPSTDNLAFAKRLKLALTRTPQPVTTAAELALQFNLRHSKASVTQQATQKWLTGQAKPTPDKIETLANWLDVSTHWLMYGSPPEKRPLAHSQGKLGKASSTNKLQSEAEAHLTTQFRKLSDYQRKLVIDLIDQLALDRDAWPSA